MDKRLVLLSFVFFALFAGACKKKEETTKTTDERLSRPYCNDPIAVNYNWDFPGTPDNSTCFYPDEVFKGTYTVYDTTFDGSFIPDSSSFRQFTISLTAVDKSRMLLSGYILNSVCTLDKLPITATRFYKATIDSTFLAPPDSTYLNGKIVCSKDTLSGYFSKAQSSGDTISISFMVAGDTGTLFHRGIGIKQ